MKVYVSGLLYDNEGKNIALILKNRPAWQMGNYNVIGGKLEPTDPSLSEAMRREAIEESGVDVEWSQRTTLLGEDYVIYYFSAHTDEIYGAKTMEDEPIHLFPVNQLPENLIYDLRWLIPLLNDSSVDVPKIFKKK